MNADDAEFLEGMRRLGATSPGAARPDRELPRLSLKHFRSLVDAGVLREAAPGMYYLFEGATPPLPASRSPRQLPAGRLVRTLIFWLLVILLPILFLQYNK
ncbi:MAG: hypothetical protein ACHQQ3_08080 [Gemmatimonadales bacterium]